MRKTRTAASWRPDGREIEMLSEHTMEGMLEGYLLTGRNGFLSSYEAFVHVIDSMFNLKDKDFDSLFTVDKPIIFNFHGYPWLIHRLTYSRTNRDLHVRAYKEKGNINTPMELAINNESDRYSLAIDAIDRIPRLQKIGAHAKDKFRNKQIECRAYAYKNGIDSPDITGWRARQHQISQPLDVQAEVNGLTAITGYARGFAYVTIFNLRFSLIGRRVLSNRSNLLYVQRYTTRTAYKSEFGSATGNRTRV